MNTWKDFMAFLNDHPLGVQLEVGDAATDFEFKSFGQELRECQRYFQSSFPASTSPSNGVANGLYSGVASAYTTNNAYTSPVVFPVQMRATPSTITFYRGDTGTTDGQWALFNGSWVSATTTSIGYANSNGFMATLTRNSSFTTYNAYLFNGAWTASAEL